MFVLENPGEEEGEGKEKKKKTIREIRNLIKVLTGTTNDNQFEQKSGFENHCSSIILTTTTTTFDLL